MSYRSYTHVLRIDKDEVAGILSGDVVVMPKLDGTNASLFVKDDVIYAGSRHRQLQEGKDNAVFRKSLIEKGDELFPQVLKYLSEHPNHIVYGEWLGAPGNSFPGHIKSYLNQGFFVFDVYDLDTESYIPYDVYSSAFGDYDKLIPVIGKFHNPTIEEIEKCLDNTDYNLAPGSKGEGIVIKNYDFRDKWGNIQIAKIVRDEYLQEKSTKKVVAGNNEEAFVNKFCTDAFMSKCQAKVMTILGMEEWDNNKKTICMFLNLCFNDLMEEEFWGFFRKKKGEVNLSVISHLTFTVARNYLKL